MNIKIGAAQINPIVGDIEGNVAKIKAAYLEGVGAGADIVVCPEMVLTGYPLEDLVLRESFVDAAMAAADDLIEHIYSLGHAAALIFGGPYRTHSYDPERRGEDGLYNMAFFVDPQEPKTWPIKKTELPNYGVFDEKRVFATDGLHGVTLQIQWRGVGIGLMICEDCWFDRVSAVLIDDQPCDILIAINGSPFEVGKNVKRRQVVAKRIRETGRPFVYVNMVGGQDELVFDGGSFAYDGHQVFEAPDFKECVTIFDMKIEPAITLNNYTKVEPTACPEIYRAIVLGTRDYLTKQGFASVVLGMSGGVDSGIVAAIAADAIGGENVHLVRLPSNFSSQHSLNDASAAAQRLGAPIRTIRIEPIVKALRAAYSGSIDHGSYNDYARPITQADREYAVANHMPFQTDEYKAEFLAGKHDHDHRMQNLMLTERKRLLTGTADENIQARARSNVLMSISNQEGHILLTTGNKSEVSVGYATIYGDMSGGFNPIKDCYKTTVWDLCRWRNGISEQDIEDYGFMGRATDVVPESIIVKPPSAELRPDQKDTDSLPPYEVLDAILRGMIEQEKSIDELEHKGFERALLIRVRRLIDVAEYKRRQAAPGIKVTSKLHGRDRRYPIVNKWR